MRLWELFLMKKMSLDKNLSSIKKIMQNKILFILFLFLSFSFQCQNNYTELPPGTIKLNDSIYIDVAPVDHLMYWEYTGYLQNLPDGLIIRQNDSIGYNYDLRLQFYPILNISIEEAKAYCNWRTNRVKILWQRKSIYQKDLKFPVNFRYRLPKTSEFNEAIDVFEYTKSKYKQVKNSFIFQYQLDYKRKAKKAIFLKNNISEYTLDSIPFGNNWKGEKTFSEPNYYTGFRCVCEIIE